MHISIAWESETPNVDWEGLGWNRKKLKMTSKKENKPCFRENVKQKSFLEATEKVKTEMSRVSAESTWDKRT
jgi:hypothetical protein